MPPRFTDADAAWNEWGANCGPAAIAAICGLTLAELRPHMGDFEKKHYTNPSLMWDVLDRLAGEGVISGWEKRRNRPLCWPIYGLVRIQWHGPWTAPGVPKRVAYRHTHWVGAATRDGIGHASIGIFDVNALSGVPSGWISLVDWDSSLVPWILEHCEPNADGNWSLTHVVEVGRLT